MAGHSFVGNAKIKHVYIGNTKLKRMYVGNNNVWSGASLVTYVVDTTDTKTQEIDEGISILSPSFTPTKSGWTFLGWREDKTASGTVLTTKTATGEPMTVYAVFQQAITVTKYNGSNSTTTETKYRYYNNGNISNPSFTLTQNALSGWNKAGWTTSASGYSATVADGGTVTLSASATYYSLYTVGITVTKYNGSTSASTETKNRIANVHSTTTYSNPSFTLTENAVSGWSARGWTTSASGYSATVANGGSVTLTGNATYYSLYQQTITVTYYNNSNSASSTSGTRVINYHSSATYSNPSFTLNVAGVSGWTPRGWSTSSGSTAGISYSSGVAFTRDSNITLYASWSKTVTVTYYNNSASASSTSGTAYRSYKGDISNASFTLTVATVSGWSIRGWSTSSGASAGITYNSGVAFSRSDSVTLYASWSKTVTVSYNGNGATSGSTSASTGTAYRGYKGDVTSASITLRANGFVRTHYTYSKWGSSSSGGTQYNPSQAYSFSDSITLYALWSMVSTPWTIGTGNPYFNTSGLFSNTSVQGGEANISTTYMNVNTNHQAVGGYPLGRIEGSINPQGCNRVRFTVSNVYSYWTNASAIVFAGQTIQLNSSGQYVLTLTPTWTSQSFTFTNQSPTRDVGYGNAQLDKIEFYNA